MQDIAQLNIRLDSAIKAQGEEQLRRIGLTPTEFMRALWEKVAQGGDALAHIDAIIRPEADRAARSAHERKLEAFAAGQGLYAKALTQLGVEGDIVLEELDDAEALLDEMEQRMEGRLS